MIYLQLFFEFFRVGLFSIGGGLATIPFLNDLAAKTGWFTTAEITDMIAISEATPGAVGINMATYAGFSTAGVCGAVLATLGLIAPSIIVILIIYFLFQKYQENRVVQGVLRALRPASLALICTAALELIVTTMFDCFRLSPQVHVALSWKRLLLAIALGVLWKKHRTHPILYIVLAAILGALLL